MLPILIVGGVIEILSGERGPEGWALVAIFILALIAEKAQTIYHAGHYVNEYIPLEKTSRR